LKKFEPQFYFNVIFILYEPRTIESQKYYNLKTNDEPIPPHHMQKYAENSHQVRHHAYLNYFL